jgi:UDP-N-acetylglucosamine 1-carboxyvinyltransferase
MPGDPTPEVVAIHPGRPLTGTVRVDGSKNAALPLLAAAAALRRPVQLGNVPANTDVTTMLDLLRHAGWHVAHPVAEPRQVVLVPGSGAYAGTDLAEAARIRASYYLIPALLRLYGQARLPWPGGCRIGERGMELHFTVYEAFGDRVTADDSGYLVESQTARTGPVTITFPFRSRGATIAAVLRAVVAGRPLRLGRPNISPEVLSVIEALALTGWGTQVAAEALVLEPVAAPASEGTVSWTVPGDKIEAGTLACAAAVTGGTVRIENVRNEDVASIVAALADLGVTSYTEPTALVVDARDVQPSPSPLRAIASLSPGGLDADFEPPLMALALTRPGTHLFADAINPRRHSNLLPQLARMGAEITELSPTQCRVTGPQQLQGAAVEATDIRTGSALMVAGLAAEGITTLVGVDQLRRGHADLPGKLRALGADIGEVAP